VVKRGTRIQFEEEAIMAALNRRSLLLGGTALVGLAALPFAATFLGNAVAGEGEPVPGSFEVTHTDDEWRKILGDDAFNIMRRQGTEYPGSSPLLNEHRPGIFACAGCDLPLFDASTKFESGTGWPSFYQPLPNAVATMDDGSLGMQRTEVHCRRCGGHLGHLFDDGPKPTGLRYCMDGLALKFEPKAA
jgi:peptide-methionine (R)-S-oxide reductase